jgi:hypothetical protein
MSNLLLNSLLITSSLTIAPAAAAQRQEPAVDYRIVFRYRAGGPASIKEYESTVGVFECQNDGSEKLIATFTGSIFPDDLTTRGRVKDGRYDLYLGLHRRSKDGKALTPSKNDLVIKSQGWLRPALIVNADGPVPVDSLKPGKTTSTYIHVHNGYRERRSSEGCLTLTPGDWPRFIAIFLDRYKNLADWHAGDKYYGRKVAILEVEPQKDAAVEIRYQPFTDADLQQLPAPEKLETLLLRGHEGYGSSTVTNAGVAYLTRCKNLRVLALGALRLTDRALEAIGELDNLEELSLDSNKITGSGLKHLVRLKKLQKLNLNLNPLQPETLDVLPSLVGLTRLDIQCPFPADDILLARCSTLEKLESLRLPSNTAQVTDRGLEHLSRLQLLKNLSLAGSRHVTDAGLATVAQMTRLESVGLAELPSVTPRGIEVLGKLTALRRLELNRVPMDSASIRTLSPLKHLEHLLLWSVAFEPLELDGLGQLAALREFRTNQRVPSSAIRALARLDRLESITDELTDITDEDLEHLAHLPKLRVLVLGSEHVTAAALPTLAKMTSLRDLYVTDKVRISPEQLTALGQDSLTRCRISRFRPPYTVYYQPRAETSSLLP